MVFTSVETKISWICDNCVHITHDESVTIIWAFQKSLILQRKWSWNEIISKPILKTIKTNFKDEDNSRDEEDNFVSRRWLSTERKNKLGKTMEKVREVMLQFGLYNLRKLILCYFLYLFKRFRRKRTSLWFNFWKWNDNNCWIFMDWRMFGISHTIPGEKLNRFNDNNEIIEETKVLPILRVIWYE